MSEIIKLQALISFLDSYKFGGYTPDFMDYYIDHMINYAEDNLLECLLIIKFKGFRQVDADYFIRIAKDYYQKVRDKYS